MLVVPTLTTNTLAQLNNGWTTYTSDKCKVSFEYPSNWVLKVKRGPFDTNMTYEVELYNPELDLNWHISFLHCWRLHGLKNHESAHANNETKSICGTIFRE